MGVLRGEPQEIPVKGEVRRREGSVRGQNVGALSDYERGVQKALWNMEVREERGVGPEERNHRQCGDESIGEDG